MTNKDLIALLNKQIDLYVEELKITIPVTVLEFKNSYGNTRILVTPVGGTGEAWVDTKRIKHN